MKLDTHFDLDAPLLTEEERAAIREKAEKEAADKRLQLAQEREDKRKAKAIAMQDRRFRNRERIKKEQEELAERKQPESKLKRLWEANWSALPPEQQETITAQNRECLLLWAMIDACLENGEKGVIAAPFPVETFNEVRQFLAANPPANNYPVLEVVSRLDAETLRSFDDQNFISYGRITRIPAVIYAEFCRHVLDWFSANPDQTDAEVKAAMEQILRRKPCI